MKALLFTLFVIPSFVHFSLAQIIGKSFGAQATAMGETAIVYPNAFASLANPALLPQNKNKQLALFQEIPFLQKDLSMVAISYHQVFGQLSISPCLVQFGNEYFKQQTIALGLAQKLAKHAQLGITVGFISTSALHNNRNGQSFLLVGTAFQAMKRVTMGSNLTWVQAGRKTENQQNLLIGYSFGASVQLDSAVTCTLAYQSNNLHDAQIGSGMSYTFSPTFSLQLGCVFPEVSPSLNMCYVFKNLQLHIGFGLNRNLGTSPFSELQTDFLSPKK